MRENQRGFRGENRSGNNEKKKDKGRKRKKNPDLGPGARKIEEFEENAPKGAGGSGRVRPHPPRGFGNFGGIWGVLGFCRFRRRRRRPFPFPLFLLNSPEMGKTPQIPPAPSGSAAPAGAAQ